VVDFVGAAGPDLVDVVVDVLSESGPLAEEQLAAAVLARGVVLGEDPDGELDEALDHGDGLAASLTDGRWAWLPALLAGRVFTHRLRPDEVCHDVLTICPDLEPLSVLLECEDYQCLADGAPIGVVLEAFDADVLDEREIPVEVLDEDGGLLLPPGYLVGKGLRAGEVIGIGLSGDRLRLTAADESRAGSAELARLGAVLGTVVAERADEPVELDTAVWTACAREPELFTEATLPLGEALGRCGLSWQGDWLASGGFDFDRWWLQNKVGALADRHGLDEDEALAVAATVSLYEQIAELHAAAQAAWDSGGQPELSALLATEDDPAPGGASGPTPPLTVVSGSVSEQVGVAGGQHYDEPDERATMRATVAAAMELLAEPAVAEAVLAETLGSGQHGAPALGLFAETCEPLAPRRARVALRWLRAKAHERLGELTEAEAAYLHAQTLDPGWPPTLYDLARYASDRGDATRGLALLRRAGAPADDDLARLLEHFQPTPRPGMGRNQRCWCGSGRKYKQCHLHREVAALEQRAGWLYQKAGMFLNEGPWWETVGLVAIERARHAETPAAVRAAMDDPLVADAVLFEGGAFEDFLATRGALLPDDERLLGQRWLLIERSVHEVEALEWGQGLRLRDVRTGDTHQVRERSASRQLRTGDLVCARVVPAGDTMQIFGGIEPVGLGERDALIELLDRGPDPVELVGVLTRRFAPLALCNTEGDPLVFCEASLASADPTALAQALDARYDRTEETSDGEHDADVPTARWFEHVTTQGMERIRATVELTGQRVRVHTNSEARLERVLAVLAGIEPTITLVEQTRRPGRDAREMADLATQFPAAGSSGAPKPLDPGDPDVAAALARFARDYEHRWLDEPIPALAGRTPREAAADPTRRGDLARLLDTFPTPDSSGPAMMDPDRLRAALGI
jgi:tetratricopeptide (TPR) repeat protein